MPHELRLRLGVISDTHGHLANTRQAVRKLIEAEVDVVLHCGDIGSAEIVPLLARWPTHFVFGNVDRDRQALERAIVAAGQTSHGEFGECLLAGKRVALLHGDDTRRFTEVVRSGEYDLVCYGHTHQRELRVLDGRVVLNPGAVYRARPHSIAVVELPALAAQHIVF